MKHYTNATRNGLHKLVVSAMLGGVVAIALAGCHVDPAGSTSDGGKIEAANSNSNSGSIKPTPKPTPAPTPAPTPTQTPTTAASNATISCSGFPGGGMIYKPVSEGDHKLVVLIQSFQAESTPVAMADKNGHVIEQGRFAGRTNGNRPTYRFGRPGHAYPSPAILKVGGANICIPNTAARFD